MGNRKKSKLSYSEIKKLREPSNGNMFTIDKIKKKWRDSKTGEVQYLVSWLGFTKSYDTWEPPSSFASCMEVITEFEEKKKRLAASRMNMVKKGVKNSVNSLSPCPKKLFAKRVKFENINVSSHIRVPRIEKRCKTGGSNTNFSYNVSKLGSKSQPIIHGQDKKVEPFGSLLVIKTEKNDASVHGLFPTKNVSVNAVNYQEKCKASALLASNLAIVKVEKEDPDYVELSSSEALGNQYSKKPTEVYDNIHESNPNSLNHGQKRCIQEVEQSTYQDDVPIPLLSEESSNTVNSNSESMPFLGEPYFPETQYRIHLLTSPEIEQKVLKNGSPELIGALTIERKIHLIGTWKFEQSWTCCSLDLARRWFPSSVVTFFSLVPRFYISLNLTCGMLQRGQCRFWGPHFNIDKVYGAKLEAGGDYCLLHDLKENEPET